MHNILLLLLLLLPLLLLRVALLQLGVRVALDLASWEVLQSHWAVISEALLSGCVDLCFCNQVCSSGVATCSR
jgi:hypothetical protein